MRITIIGGAGFIGTNLALNLCRTSENKIRLIARLGEHLHALRILNLPNVYLEEGSFDDQTDFDEQVRNSDYVYHLASTIIPGTSNYHIAEELESNVVVTARFLDACVRQKVERVVFLSSGGTVYGKKGSYPIAEDTVTYPISTYGIQKLTIEKLLYLYRFQHGLDYRIIRLANPYGPYQRPNGRLGVVTTFVYKALTDRKLEVYGDGSIVRDYIYIDDAIRGIIAIANGESDLRVFNLGTGKGTSINEIISVIKQNVCSDLQVSYVSARSADIPVNYLDISRYEENYGCLNPISLEEGIRKTAEFFRSIENNPFCVTEGK